MAAVSLTTCCQFKTQAI